MKDKNIPTRTYSRSYSTILAKMTVDHTARLNPIPKSTVTYDLPEVDRPARLVDHSTAQILCETPVGVEQKMVDHSSRCGCTWYCLVGVKSAAIVLSLGHPNMGKASQSQAVVDCSHGFHPIPVKNLSRVLRRRMSYRREHCRLSNLI
eukprot:1486322-Amphidinium_carterae.1